MAEYVGAVCPYCDGEIKDQEAVKVCPRCGAPHHSICWEANSGCANLKCKGHGENLADTCSTYNSPKNENICGKCGADLQEGQVFCPKCGQRIDAPADSAKRKRPIIIAAVAAAVLVAVIVIASVGRTKGPKFNDLYDEYCSSIWASAGADGSYLSIDTNPYDLDDEGLAFHDAYTAIKNINSALGLPDSLIEDMGATRAMDGKQSETFSKQGIVVDWRYHPDKGLEVTYKKN